MTKKKHTKPTESELEVLQILWESGPSSVRFVNERLNEQKQEGVVVGYTTTLKIMQIMAEKSLVARDTTQRTHIYSAAVDEQSTQEVLLKKFVDAAFRGSAKSLVLSALGNHRTSQAELEEIKAMISKLEIDEDASSSEK